MGVHKSRPPGFSSEHPGQEYRGPEALVPEATIGGFEGDMPLLAFSILPTREKPVNSAERSATDSNLAQWMFRDQPPISPQ